MPRRARELSAVEVRRLQDGLHAVGGVAGLNLQIGQNGAKSWVLRLRFEGKRRELGLGPYPEVTLAMARENARVLADRIRRGEGAAVLAERRKEPPGRTVEDTIEDWLKVKLTEVVGEKNKVRYRSVLDRYAVPALGRKAVAEVTLAEVADCLRPIWTDKTETATKVRERLEAAFNYAIAHGWRTAANPAMWRGGLAAMLPSPGRSGRVTHFPTIAGDDAPAWFRALRGRDGTSARALELLTLTALRSGEVRALRWEYIDAEKAIAVIPAAVMKMKREHRVPLTPPALALLERLPRGSSGLVFEAPRKGMLSDMSLSAVMRRMHDAEIEAGRRGWLDPISGRPSVPHGIRSTFRDWASEHTEFPREVAELCLAHSVGSAVEQAYRRGDLLAKRRALMAAWALHLGA